MLDPKKIIIEKPEALDEAITIRDKIITFLFWGLLIYIFRPLFALILWILFGIHVFNPDIFNIGLYEDITKFIAKNSFTIFSFAAIFISWAIYNKIVFGKLKRRKAIPRITDEEIAKFYKVDIDNLKKWKHKKYLKFKIVENDSMLKIIEAT